jgi:putative ATPase
MSYVLNAFTKADLESLLQRALTVDSLRNKSIELRETEALLRLQMEQT